MSKTYYFLEMEKFQIPDTGFLTSQQQTLPHTKIDADPISSLTLVEQNFYRQWLKLSGVHEIIDRTPRRLAGDPEYLSMSIVGGHHSFDCFFNEADQLLLLNTSKTNALGIQKRLIQHFPNNFVPKKTEVNFEHLLRNLQNAQIVSSWFNEIQGKVNAVGLFGRRVNLDDVFTHFSETGKLSAISIEMNTSQEEEPINFMVTKNAGVVLYTDWDKKKDLDFLFDLKPLLLHNTNTILN